jgi:hypothetical protein
MNRVLISNNTHGVGKDSGKLNGFLTEFNLDTMTLTDKLNIPHPNVAFGICFYKDLLYVGVYKGLNIYNNKYELVRSVTTEDFVIDGVHQMVEHQDKIYMANTAKDSIAIFDIKTESFSEFKITEESKDTKHVNSIYFEDDLMYVMCHNKAPSDIFVYKNFKFEKAFHRTGVMSHNIWKMNGDLWYNNSVEQKIQSVSGKRIDFNIDNGYVSFLRGQTIINNKLLIGLSFHRYNPLVIPRNRFSTMADELEKSIGGVCVMDLDSLKIENVVHGRNTAEIINIPDNWS